MGCKTAVNPKEIPGEFVGSPSGESVVTSLGLCSYHVMDT